MSNGKIKLVVINEHTLGYMTPEHNNERAGILRASVLRGSSYNEGSGCIYVKYENVRLATPKDFDDYRVLFTPEGFGNTNVYEFQNL